MSLDLEGDLSLADGVQGITYVKVTPGGETSFAVTAALRRAAPRADARLLPPQVALTPEDVLWHVAASALPNVVPSAGDRVVAGEQVWIVAAAEQVSLGSRWRLFCRKARS
jgi:hypothetical protein